MIRLCLLCTNGARSRSHINTTVTLLSLFQLRRAAPHHKGVFRHAYIEKMWTPCIVPEPIVEGLGTWNVVERNGVSECIICQSSLAPGSGAGQRYRCASCAKFVLFRTCYSQVQKIHPLRAFLDVPVHVERTQMSSAVGMGQTRGVNNGRGSRNESTKEKEKSAMMFSLDVLFSIFLFSHESSCQNFIMYTIIIKLNTIMLCVI
jgi:hypothetical protein